MAQSETDLHRLLHSTEHSFVERKTFGDTKDWVKTVVAFANSLRDDQEGVLFIGATDDGAIQDVPTNLDKLQMTFSEKIQSIYPPVYYTTKTVRENEKECLVVIVPGSPARPHFAGPPFVRDGSRTVVASSGRYESLLAARTGKAFELQRWEGKLVSVRTFSRQAGIAYVVNQRVEAATILVVNQFYLTVSFGNRTESHPLNKLEISYDNSANRLEVQIEGVPTPY
jgi:predicted HTH transcriptional regulator